MSDLIERLKNASIGDIRLDAEIWCVTNDHEFISYNGYGGNITYQPKIMRARMSYNLGLSQFYTTSIDAALSLMPPGYEWLLHSSCSIEVARKLDPWGKSSLSYAGTTLPLTLCIAGLSTREMK